jgi:methyltransferase (TIGR00027 family)
MQEALIQSISDTARWVAYHRATESEREDALFNDPYARQLAGERGELIGRRLSGNAWAIAIRTLLFDNLILQQLARTPIDTVVNLAAGLDSRPYRLKLSPNLHWVEIDLPDIVEVKNHVLAAERANCRLRVLAHDLSDTPLRRRIFTELNANTTRAMVLSEGLLTYLTEEEVTNLSAEIHAQPHFQYWIVEVVSPKVVESVQREWGEHLAIAKAPMRFAPDDWRTFYSERGWKVVTFGDMTQVAMKHGRQPAPSAMRKQMRRMLSALGNVFPYLGKRSKLWESGVAILEKK